LIEDAEQLLDGVDEQLRRIRETMDELPDGSVIMIESLDDGYLLQYTELIYIQFVNTQRSVY